MKVLLPFHIFAEFLMVVLVASAVASVRAQNAPDSMPRMMSAPKFELAVEARAAGIEGYARVGVRVLKSGEVKIAKVISGPDATCAVSSTKLFSEVRESVEANVLAAKFQPGTSGGDPKDMDILLTFKVGDVPRDQTGKVEPKNQPNPEPTGATMQFDPTPKTIAGGVLNGKAGSLAKPGYPALAKAAGAGGAVSVQILIDEEGKIITAKAVSGHPYLHEASRIAACSSRFSTTTLSGQPVKVSGIITYNFVP